MSEAANRLCVRILVHSESLSLSGAALERNLWKCPPVAVSIPDYSLSRWMDHHGPGTSHMAIKATTRQRLNHFTVLNLARQNQEKGSFR